MKTFEVRIDENLVNAWAQCALDFEIQKMFLDGTEGRDYIRAEVTRIMSSAYFRRSVADAAARSVSAVIAEYAESKASSIFASMFIAPATPKKKAAKKGR